MTTSGSSAAPGPDLVWPTGYRPTAITERLTVLFLTAERPPWGDFVPVG